MPINVVTPPFARAGMAPNVGAESPNHQKLFCSLVWREKLNLLESFLYSSRGVLVYR